MLDPSLSAAAANAKIQAMVAANQYREMQGHAQAYGEEAFLEIADELEGKERSRALDVLLKPITWDERTSVNWRREFVRTRRKQVALVRPFLTPAEKVRADEWSIREKHDDLFD